MAKEAVPPLSLDSVGVKAGTTEAEKKQSGWRADLGRLRRLFTYVKPYKGRLAIGLLLGGVYGAISGVFPKAVQLGSQALLESDEPPSLAMVIAASLAIPVYFTFRGAIGFLNTYCLNWVAGRMLRDLRVEIFNHLQLLSMDFFVRNRVATLMQRVHNNTARMQRALIGLSSGLIKRCTGSGMTQ